MIITLLDYSNEENSKVLTHEIGDNEEIFTHFLMKKQWPDVVIHEGVVYQLEDWSPDSASYSRTLSCVLDIH